MFQTSTFWSAIDPTFAATWDPRTWHWTNPDQIVAISSVVALILIPLASVVAFIQWKEAVNARQERSRPFVIIDVYASHGTIFRFEVKNIGLTVARDVTFSFTPPFESTLEQKGLKIGDIPILASGAKSMAPGKSYTMIADQAPARKQADLPNQYEVAIEYTGPDGTPYTDHLTIDFGLMWGMPDVRDLEMHDLVKEVKDLNRSLKNLESRIPPPNAGG